MLLIFQVRVEILLDLASVTTIIHDLNLDKDDHDKNVNRFCFGSPPWATQNCSTNEHCINIKHGSDKLLIIWSQNYYS